MNEQEFKNRVEERWGGSPGMRSRGRALTGVVIFFIGILLLLKTANMVWFPSWFFTWPMLLIALGLLSGIKHGFRGGFWLILLLIGGLSLADRLDPTLHMDHYIWPIILISIGLMFILRPRRHHRWRNWRGYHYRSGWQQEPDAVGVGNSAEATSTGDYDRRDFIDVTAVFGGVKKKTC